MNKDIESNVRGAVDEVMAGKIEVKAVKDNGAAIHVSLPSSSIFLDPDEEDYRGEVIFALDPVDGTQIVLHQCPNDNLILKQGDQEIVLSWDEFQELSEFYRESQDKLISDMEVSKKSHEW